MNELLVQHVIKESIFDYRRKNRGQYRLDINVNKNYILGNYIIYKNRKIKFSARVYYHYYIFLSYVELESNNGL